MNRRSDWFWKLAHELTDKFDVLCFETLNLKGMQRLWGRKISDLAFSEFLHILEWVAKKKGKRKDSGLKTCGSNACLARVLGQNKGFCLSWLIVNKRGEVTVFRGLLRIEIDLVSSSISKVFAQEGVQ